VYRYHHE